MEDPLVGTSIAGAQIAHKIVGLGVPMRVCDVGDIPQSRIRSPYFSTSWSLTASAEM